MIFDDKYSLENYKKLEHKRSNRTVSDYHRAWLKAVVRQEQHRKKVVDCIDEIINTVKPDEKGNYNVYIKSPNEKGHIIRYTFRYEEMFKTYGCSSEHIKVETRKDKIAVLADDVGFDMGEKYSNLVRSRPKIQGFLFNKMFSLIKDYLNYEVYENTSYLEPRVISVSINDIKYYLFLKKDNYICDITWIGDKEINNLEVSHINKTL